MLRKARKRTIDRSSLKTYHAKRRFKETPEPKGRKGTRQGWSYLIQKHDATRLHYDFRLELDGVLKSWAVTRGPSLDPRDKRLAIRTEDHPLDYGKFEGTIPKGNYGAGTVMLWDRGSWSPVGDPHEGLKKGKLVFELLGERLRGRWALIRFRGKQERQEPWLLIKEVDAVASAKADVLKKFATSVTTGRNLDRIAAGAAPKTKKKTGANRHRRLPGFIEPALATLVDEVPRAKDWVFEIKFDGYRVLTAASGPSVLCYSRNGLDWTGRFGRVPEAIRALQLDGALLDGEIAVINKAGRSDFSALQKSLGDENGRGISYFVFDLLADGGKDLRSRPLAERKRRLKELLAPASRTGPVFFVDHIDGDGKAMLDKLCGRGFEGVIAKKINSPYRTGRGHAWLKIKCNAEQEFVLVGYTPSDKDRAFSSVLLAVREKGKLRYVGRVGSGFDTRELDTLHRRFRRLARKSPAIDADPVPPPVRRTACWIEPKLVAEIAFAGFTGDGMVRQGRYLGLREDKAPASVRRERPAKLREVIR